MDKNFATDVQDVDSSTQQIVNKPPVDPTGFNDGDQEFIQSVMTRVYSGEINLMMPSSLLNESVYEAASEEAQGKADSYAVNFCSKLRDIKGLMEMSGGDTLYVEPTYQVQLLIKDLKYRKEEFEKQYGDLFVI